jgi:hypothetical protein
LEKEVARKEVGEWWVRDGRWGRKWWLVSMRKEFKRVRCSDVHGCPHCNGPRSPPFGSSRSVVLLRVTCHTSAADEVLGNALHAGDDEINGHVEDDGRLDAAVPRV